MSRISISPMNKINSLFDFSQILVSTWINQTTFSLYNSLFTIQLAIWSHSLCFLPYIDILYSAICSNKMEQQKWTVLKLVQMTPPPTSTHTERGGSETQWTFQNYTTQWSFTAGIFLSLHVTDAMMFNWHNMVKHNFNIHIVTTGKNVQHLPQFWLILH